jgi:hypothetical protein
VLDRSDVSGKLKLRSCFDSDQEKYVLASMLHSNFSVTNMPPHPNLPIPLSSVGYFCPALQIKRFTFFDKVVPIDAESGEQFGAFSVGSETIVRLIKLL